MKTSVLFLLLLLVLAVPSFAQDVYYPDYGDIGGGFGGHGCSYCEGGPVYGFDCRHLFPLDPTNPAAPAVGYTICEAHNALGQGPAYCAQGGDTCYGEASDNGQHGMTPEVQIAGILAYFREAEMPNHSRVVSDADLNDFIATSDWSLRGLSYRVALEARLSRYRAKFKELAHRELPQGMIPVWGHKPTKAPSSTVAAL